MDNELDLPSERKIFCKKCGAVMVKGNQPLKKSIDMYSGTSSTVFSSTATTVTTDPSYANIFESLNKKPAVKLTSYICPSCNWKTQIRD